MEVIAHSQDGMTPPQQLQAISVRASELMLTQQTCWRKLREDLRGAGISVVRPNELIYAERDWLLS